MNIFFKKSVYWHLVDLQCCVNFCCIAKWVHYTYICILFHILFHYGLSQNIEYSSVCYTVGPCYSVYNSLHLRIPNSQSVPPSQPLPTEGVRDIFCLISLHIFVSWMLSFKPTFSLSSFTFIKRLFSSSSLYAIRVVSSAYLRLLIFFPAILIPAVHPAAQSFSWRTSIQSAKTRLRANCGSDHELLIAKFKLKLKKVGKTKRPFRYYLNQILKWKWEIDLRD